MAHVVETLREPEAVIACHALAIYGDPPILSSAPYEDAGIVREAADEVAEIVRSGRTCYWGGGPKARELEASFARLTHRKHAFFHSSGSSALITAVFATGAGPGRPVVIGSSGFVAAINAVYHNRARPIFLATDERTLQATHLGSVEFGSEQPAALLLTHFLGNVVDVPTIASNVAASYVIEDGGQAHGATLDGVPVGSMSDIGSFAGSHKKLVTAGQGGINVCDASDLLARMRMVGHHGKSARGVGEVPGYNFRGGEMEAVLALYAMRELADRVAARNATAEAIQDVLDGAGIVTATPISGRAKPAWFDVAIVLPQEWGPHRDWLVTALNAENIPVASYPSLIEMPWLKPWMQSEGWWTDFEEDLQRSEKELWGRVIVIGTQMSPEDGRRCGRGIVDVLTGARGATK
ncbi:DegT/DnrJ/EryC1/StrS family aminotransferase [uncultured Microbacterium sp.]|uniref:DegT/DnrJ/EryC1/StrS family aminotransferase n=1 Tax=uncultured Microbacterium sp. TaxID=191216 RepID=UPI0035CC7217